MSDEEEDLVVVEEEAVAPPDPGRFATLGEILEAHHRRFVERMRRRRQGEEQSE